MTDPEHLFGDYAAKLEEAQRTAEEVRSTLDSVRSTARADDGRVAVTVNASGNVVDLRLPDADLAATVLRTIRQAQARLAETVHTSAPPSLAGSAVLAELDTQYRTNYPEPAPDDQPRPRRTLRLGTDDEPAPPPQAAPRRPRPEPPGPDDFADRNLLR